MHSIKNGTTHVIEDAHGRMIAMFAVSFSPDKNYERPIDGAWLTDTSAEPQPMRSCIGWPSTIRLAAAASACSSSTRPTRSPVRAPVQHSRRRYELNGPMQNLLEKHGYERCGTITIKDVFGRVKHRVGYERNVALTEGVFTP